MVGEHTLWLYRSGDYFLVVWDRWEPGCAGGPHRWQLRRCCRETEGRGRTSSPAVRRARRGSGGADSILFFGCFFTETTNIGYLSQGPENLSPIPDPTCNLEQFIPPDPAPGSRKASFPLSQSSGMRRSPSKRWEPVSPC